MCSYRTLHHCEHGYVLRCERCGHLNIGFGTTVLALTDDQFYAFADKIEDLYAMHGEDREQHRKHICVPTATSSVTLIYSLNDLKHLSVLLDKAKDRLLLEKLFVFHDN